MNKPGPRLSNSTYSRSVHSKSPVSCIAAPVLINTNEHTAPHLTDLYCGKQLTKNAPPTGRCGWCMHKHAHGRLRLPLVRQLADTLIVKNTSGSAEKDPGPLYSIRVASPTLPPIGNSQSRTRSLKSLHVHRQKFSTTPSNRNIPHPRSCF